MTQFWKPIIILEKKKQQLFIVIFSWARWECLKLLGSNSCEWVLVKIRGCVNIMFQVCSIQCFLLNSTASVSPPSTAWQGRKGYWMLAPNSFFWSGLVKVFETGAGKADTDVGVCATCRGHTRDFPYILLNPRVIPGGRHYSHHFTEGLVKVVRTCSNPPH